MKQRKPIVLFLPEAGIHPFLQTVSLIGNAFLQHGHPVYLIECNGVLDRCPMQASFGNQRFFSTEGKRQLCDNCTRNVKNASAFFGFNILPINDFISEKEILPTNITFPQEKSEYEKIEYKGCKVGKLAIHDLMIETKILSISDDLSFETLKIYQGYIISMTRIITIVENISRKISPLLYIVFNPYSQNQAVKYSADFFGSSYAMISNKHHCGANWQLLEHDGSLFGYNQIMNIELWKNNSSLLVPSSGIFAAFEDLIYRMNEEGSHIFSSSRGGNLQQFTEKHNLIKKTIFIAFTTSQDERLGSDICRAEWGETIGSTVVFKTQIEWLLFLKNFAYINDDVFCIARIHPREARDGGSEHLKLLKKEFCETYTKNFLIIWPDDPISSYDLMEIADVCLVSSSTTGLECMRLGVPVIAYYAKRGYVDDEYICVPTDIEQYEKALYNIYKIKPAHHYLLNAVRFYYWRVLLQSLYLGDNIPRNNLPNNVYFKASEEVNSIIYDIFTKKTSIFEYNYKKLKENQENISKMDEYNSLRTGIIKLVNSLFNEVSPKRTFFWKIKRKIMSYAKFAKKDSNNNGKIKSLIHINDITKFDDTLKKSRRKRNVIFVLQDGIYSYRVFRGKYKRRISKAASRLAKMYMTIPFNTSD